MPNYYGWLAKVIERRRIADAIKAMERAGANAAAKERISNATTQAQLRTAARAVARGIERGETYLRKMGGIDSGLEQSVDELRKLAAMFEGTPRQQEHALNIYRGRFTRESFDGKRVSDLTIANLKKGMEPGALGGEWYKLGDSADELRSRFARLRELAEQGTAPTLDELLDEIEKGLREGSPTSDDIDEQISEAERVYQEETDQYYIDLAEVTGSTWDVVPWYDE